MDSTMGPGGIPGSPAPNWLKTKVTAAMVAALGAALVGDITLFNLPAGTIVKNYYFKVNTPALGTATLTASHGKTAAAYTDYIGAQNVKVAATYGVTSAQRGTLADFDIPGAVAVKAHFISTVQNLDQVTALDMDFWIEVQALP